MSTKNLARTVIEGGRTGYSKYKRRTSLQTWRAKNHGFSRSIGADPDSWNDRHPPQRNELWDWDEISHADRTNPCDRFLASRAGRPWDAVHSEICRRFDRRKLTGKHVTEDHLLNRVQKLDHAHRHFYEFWERGHGPKFWVDRHGILRHNPKAKY